MESLPDRQAKLLDYLRHTISTMGFTPSIAEMTRTLGHSSQNSVVKLLDKLEARGAIARDFRSHRSLRILWPDAANDASPLLRPAHRIPFLGRIAAGTPITAGSDAAELASEFIDIDPALFETPPDMLWRVEGFSMINLGIRPGDLVGTALRSEFRNRQIVSAVVIDEKTDDPMLTLKRYEKKGSIVTLYSENDDQDTYKPLVFDTRKDPIQLVGLYCGLVRTKVQP